MRILPLIAGLVLALLTLFTASVPARSQEPDMNAIFALMQEVDKSLVILAQDMLASKRLGDIKDQGLIVAPFVPIIGEEKDGDEMIAFITTWVQEKMLTAMIKQDDEGRFAVVDKVILDKIIQEQKLDAKALRDPKNWPAIGKAADAKYMVTGSFVVLPVSEKPFSMAVSITARVVALDTGKAISAGSVDFVYKQQPTPPVQ